MSVHVFITYRLRPEASIEEFRKYSRELDQPTVTSQPGVISERVYEVQGTGRGDPEYHILEDIEVESWDAWLKASSGEAIGALYQQWKQLCDSKSMRVHWSERIEPLR